MNDSDIRALVLEYLGGPLTAERERALRSLLTEHGYTADELDELRETYARLDDIPVPAASETMTESFFQMLEEHKRRAVAAQSRSGSLIAWLRDRCEPKFIARAAFGLVLLGIGWSLGFWSAPNARYEQRFDDVTAEIQEMKGMVAYAMPSQSSPSERIRTIDRIRACGAVDERMIATLLDMLGGDPNVNVRLVALETLTTQSDRVTVRQGLVRALSQQESPLVQVALTDVLVSLNERASVSQLRELLERPDLNEAVRARVVSGLERLM